MAFFGLTKLGSQDPFEVTRFTAIHVFDQKDFEQAFLKTWNPQFHVSYEQDADQVQQKLRESKTQAVIRLDQLRELLSTLYNCPKGQQNVPDQVTDLVLHEFTSTFGPVANTSSEPTMLHLDEFLDVMLQRVCVLSQQQEQAQALAAYRKDGATSREFTSNLELRSNLAKHHRMDKDPKDKLLVPMTDSQIVGWEKPTIVNARRPNRSCDETKYASAMIKAGVYYY